MQKQSGSMRKWWARRAGLSLLLTGVITLLITAPAWAAVDTGLNYATALGLGTQDLRLAVMRIIQVLLGLLGVIATVLILYAGYRWMTAGDNADQINEAKSILRNAAIGLVIIFLSFSIVTYIFNVLTGGLTGNTLGGGPGGSSCDGCGQLGSGVVESVYPVPGAKDVSRSTYIATKFKVDMKPSSIIEGVSDSNINPSHCQTTPADCSGTLNAASVKIYQKVDGESGALKAEDVNVTTTNGREYTFQPKQYLGDTASQTKYEVRLTSSIAKSNGDSAFAGVQNNFAWNFDVSTEADVDPVEMSSVFPAPDSAADTYNQAQGAQARGTITLSRTPSVGTIAAVGPVQKYPGTTMGARVAGSYNGTFEGDLVVTINASDRSNLKATVMHEGDPDSQQAVTLSGQTVVVGDGLQFILDADPSTLTAGISSWIFNVTPNSPADTLVLNGRTYTFSATAGAQKIVIVPGTNAGVASQIAAQLSASDTQLVVTSSGLTITIQSKLAGIGGNAISLKVGGSWATASGATLTGGTDTALTASSIKGAPDQPRNAVIKIDFNEAINPAVVSDDTVSISYNKGTSAQPDWQKVTGTLFVSNMSQTVEFLPDSRCGVCTTTGNPCSQDQDCGGASGSCKILKNACGDDLFCLPVNAQDAPTNYRVAIKAGKVKSCADNSNCSDPTFNTCVLPSTLAVTTDMAAGVCAATIPTQNGSQVVLYPAATLTPGGIIDMSQNSLNGNSSTYTLNGRVFGRVDGPAAQSNKSAFNLNDAASAQAAEGDDLTWSFYINKNIDTTPPVLKEIGPTIGQTGASLTSPATGLFNKVMFGATLKPGTGYPDGMCSCLVDTDCGQGEVCEGLTGATRNPYTINGTDVGRCKNPLGSQQFCAQDSQCKAGFSCINKKYVSLLDRSTIPVGWWIGHRDLDTALPLDSYADQTRAEVQHSPFAEVTSYAVEIGSGVKDIYQNCFLPSAGPGVSTATDCKATAEKPYCCNGVAMSRQDWQNSSCVTAY